MRKAERLFWLILAAVIAFGLIAAAIMAHLPPAPGA